MYRSSSRPFSAARDHFFSPAHGKSAKNRTYSAKKKCLGRRKKHGSKPKVIVLAEESSGATTKAFDVGANLMVFGEKVMVLAAYT
jgi:hypothetical protein